MKERLLDAVERRTDDLVALTADLIRFPTVNPPGDAYRPCAEYLAARLRKSGFEAELIRAEGTPGDTDRYPRVNMVARFDGRVPGQTVHFNSHIDVVEAGEGWTLDPFAGVVRDGRVYGRGACDMKGGLAASIIAAEAFMETFPDFPGAIEISGTADEESGGFGGVGYLAGKGYFSKPKVDTSSFPNRSTRTASASATAALCGGGDRDKGEIRPRLHAFLGDCGVRHMGAGAGPFEEELFPALDAKRTTMPVGRKARGARR